MGLRPLALTRRRLLSKGKGHGGIRVGVKAWTLVKFNLVRNFTGVSGHPNPIGTAKAALSASGFDIYYMTF